VTISTVIGTGVVAALQGVLLGTAFWIADCPMDCFGAWSRWALADSTGGGQRHGVGPAAVVLIMQGRPAAGLPADHLGRRRGRSVDNSSAPSSIAASPPSIR